MAFHRRGTAPLNGIINPATIYIPFRASGRRRNKAQCAGKGHFPCQGRASASMHSRHSDILSSALERRSGACLKPLTL